MRPIDNLTSWISKTIYDRGKSYFNTGLVRDLEHKGDEWTATVHGSDQYETEANLDGYEVYD